MDNETFTEKTFEFPCNTKITVKFDTGYQYGMRFRYPYQIVISDPKRSGTIIAAFRGPADAIAAPQVSLHTMSSSWLMFRKMLREVLAEMEKEEPI